MIDRRFAENKRYCNQPHVSEMKSWLSRNSQNESSSRLPTHNIQKNKSQMTARTQRDYSNDRREDCGDQLQMSAQLLFQAPNSYCCYLKHIASFDTNFLKFDQI